MLVVRERICPVKGQPENGRAECPGCELVRTLNLETK